MTQDGDKFRVALKSGVLLVSADGYNYAGPDTTVATTFGAAADDHQTRANVPVEITFTAS